MIHEILVVTQGGLCLYHHSFTNSHINPQLVAGFTTAIDSFSQSLILKKQNIESMQMSALKLRISTFYHNQLSMVAFFNRYDDSKIIDSILFDLQTQFLELFGHLNINTEHDLRRFKSFDEVIGPLTNIHINIGILSFQSSYKTEFWKSLDKQSQKNDSPLKLTFSGKKVFNQQRDLNVIDYYDPHLQNCNFSVWNMDLEKIELSTHILTDKQIFFLIIEPNFKFIRHLMIKLADLKINCPNAQISGILISDKGKITKKNCELILQIPLYELNTTDISSTSILEETLRNAITGL